MLNLQIPTKLLRRLLRELASAGQREIGGILVGEHANGNCFKLLDFSVQHHGGSGTCFTRDPDYHRPFIDRFFEETGNDYRRFNYLGEWHSHPSFSITPSAIDLKTMNELVSDPEQNAAFALLLICRRNSRFQIALGATAFRAGSQAEKVTITVTASNKFRLFGARR